MLFNLVLSTFIILITQKIFLKKGLTEGVVNRSSHSKIATPSGGTSIFICILIYTSYYYINSDQIFDFSIIIPLSILYTIGLYDDIYKVDFKLKFIFQIIVAKILIDLGFNIDSLNGFFNIYEIPYIYSQFLTLFIFLVIVNAINFSDGIDGLAITEIIKSLVIIIILSSKNIDGGINKLFISIIVLLVPLYFFNLKKDNKVFLGDSGSLLLGGVLFIALINMINTYSVESYKINSFLLIFIIVLYPLVDLIQVVLKRLKMGLSPFIADNNHIHHKLIKRGFNHLQTLFLISLISGALQLVLMLYLAS